MSGIVTYKIKRGGDYRWILYAPVGTSLAGFTCSGQVRRVNTRTGTVDVDALVAAPLTVEVFGGDIPNELGPGFYILLAASDSDETAELEPGKYLADVFLVAPGGDIIPSQSWYLDVIESASRTL